VYVIVQVVTYPTMLLAVEMMAADKDPSEATIVMEE
jgi:hypothetical protein